MKYGRKELESKHARLLLMYHLEEEGGDLMKSTRKRLTNLLSSMDEPRITGGWRP